MPKRTTKAGPALRAGTLVAAVLLIPALWAGEGLSEGFLVGDWCYVEQQYEYAEPDPMGVNYRFSAGGGLETGLESERRSYQGQYEILPDDRIKLSQMPLKLGFEPLDEDSFRLILINKQAMFFTRGFCGD